MKNLIARELKRMVLSQSGSRRCIPVAIGICLAMALSASHGEEAGEAGEMVWSVPEPGVELRFPQAHGSHPDFRIEWWYLTAHLYSGERRFGLQATFFRLGQRPVRDEHESEFGDAQIYMAHMAVSDPEGGRFFHEERLNRGGWDAGAAVGDLDVHNGNWGLRREGGRIVLHGTVRSEAAFALELRPHKRHVVFGEDGISRKGPEGTAASYYITFPRLDAEGTLAFGGEVMEVAGEAWMDHEISSSQLDRNQVGWDWACIQFFDGRELMGYVLRTDAGEASEYSKLVWIDPAGGLVQQRLGEYRWIHAGSWRSPETGAVYPISPEIETVDPADGERRRFKLVPLLPDQELAAGAGGVSYWEGACDVFDLATGDVVGRAFLEMTGYADDIGERLR